MPRLGNGSASSWCLLIQIACTLAMTGIIWFVQVVHYPLFAIIRADDFQQYEIAHAYRTGWVVGPLMCAELATAGLMLFARFRPASFVSAREAWTGVLLVGVIWLSTLLLQVPLHDRLSRGYDAAAVKSLVTTNWVRTVAWTLRSGLVLVWMARMLRAV